MPSCRDLQQIKRGDPLFTAFHEPVEYRLLRAVHDEGDQFAPLVDDLQVFDEPLNMEEVVSGSRDDLADALIAFPAGAWSVGNWSVQELTIRGRLISCVLKSRVKVPAWEVSSEGVQ